MSPHRGDISDKWHRYCACGYRAHINALDECPACGRTNAWGRRRPGAR